ncbi:hypothetical protein [Paracoccus zhouxuedongae]|uniref:hypothetical protein n=1 Tax=Paracoccus sp. p4-l81 TaxID=3342806 RepID=UPI0035BC26D9
MMGRAFVLTGAPGVGSGTLIAAAAGLPGVRIVVTETTDPAPGPECEVLAPHVFDRRRRAGGFALEWDHAGHPCAIPADALTAQAAGRDVVMVLPFTQLAAAARCFPNLTVLHVTRPGVSPPDAEAAIPPGLPVTIIDNGGALSLARAALIAALTDRG